MLPTSAKKSARKRKVKFSHVDRDQVSLELRKWALEEMCFRPQGRHVNSRIPDPEEFKMLCRGISIIDIWSHVIQHVRSTRKVQTIKGNVKLYSLLHNKSGSKDVLKEGDTEHLKLLKRITELRSQIKQVEKDVHHPKTEILQNEQSLARFNAKRWDLEKRCALLSSYSEQCLEKAKVFDEFRRRIEGRISHCRDLRRKSSEGNTFFVQKSSLTGLIGTGNDLYSSVGLESACTRNVRETCEAIGSFLHFLHNAYIENESPTRGHNDKTNAHLWTSVETILSEHAGADVYGSLTRTALDSASNLQELTSRIDVRKDAKELKFKYENSGQLSDTSSPRPLLLSVHQLIEEGQVAHRQKYLDTEKAKNEIHKGQKLLQDFQQNMETRQKALYGNNQESLALSQTLYRTELEFVASKATMEFIQNEIKELEKIRASKQAQLEILYAKYRQIQDFQKFVQAKQNMIQVLVKHNSDAKRKLDQQRYEILKYTQDTLCTHESQVKALTSSLSDSVSKEITSFVSLSLHRLLFSDMDSHGRIPVSKLSVNRLNSCYPSNENHAVTSILRCLDFPDYMASDELLRKVVETKSKVIDTREHLKYNKTVSDSLNDMEGISTADDNNVEDVRKAVVQHEQREKERVLPKVQESFSKATKALSEYIIAMDSVNSWWEQPAQYLVPWETVDGMNMRQWKDQWTVLTTRLRQLQSMQ